MSWPTTTDPKTEFVTLRLTVGEAAELDVAAAAAHPNRSSYVRDAVAEKIERDRAAQARAVARKSRARAK